MKKAPRKKESEEDRFVTKKSLGQHFLNSPYVPRLMADAAHIGNDDIVLEVGPGTGALTRELLVRGAKVMAIEADGRAVAVLKKTFAEDIAAGKLVVVKRDMRSASLSDLGLVEHGYKVVSNIPYYLSGKLFRTFLETDLQPSVIVFLVQKEVAERIARDKKESLLSLSVKAYGNPHYIQTISKNHFSPPPKVDSAIVCIDAISHERMAEVDDAFFFDLLHEGFGSRRKQLMGNLAGRFEREVLMHIFSTLGVDERIRAEDLGLEMWFSLVKHLQKER